MQTINQVLILVLSVIFWNQVQAQREITVTIGYPDHPDYFIYSIPQSDEHARFGGEYYFKVTNTGSEALTNWELFTTWKTLNSTWGVVNKTTINAATGEIKLSGPNWDPTLSIGESFVLNGEWIPSGSVEDWIDFLPRSISMSATGGTVNVIYDTEGTVQGNSYLVQKVKPIDEQRKTFVDKKIVAYFPIFDAQNAWCSLQKYGGNIDQLRVQLYSISSSGELRAGQDLPAGVNPTVNIDFWYDSIVAMGVVDFCVQNNIELIPVVYNYNSDIGDFEQVGVHNMMVNSVTRSNHLQDLENLLVSHPEFSGIDIDYESLQSSDRDNYSSFMEDLAIIVHSHNKILTTAVHTKVGHGTWFGPQAQDIERIGNAVDEILLMTYDLHWATSPTYSNPPPTAGCQSTSDWMNDVACFAISEIDDPSKIQLGMPFYGYRWKEGFENHTLNDPGIGLTNEEALLLMNEHGLTSNDIQRDANGGDPYFNVSLNNINWVCYFQDSVSIHHKLSSLAEYDLKDYIGGVGIWRLGGENDGMWHALTTKIHGNLASISNSECQMDDNTAIIEANIPKEFNVYPNPVNSILYLEIENSVQGIAKVYDIIGTCVLSENIYFSGEKAVLDLSLIHISEPRDRG